MTDVAVLYDELSEEKKASINVNPSTCVETLSKFLTSLRTSIVRYEARGTTQCVSSHRTV